VHFFSSSSLCSVFLSTFFYTLPSAVVTNSIVFIWVSLCLWPKPLREKVSGLANSWTAALSLTIFFAWTCISTISRTLLNFKVISQRSRSWVFLVFFCMCDTAATRGQYLALSKAWWSSFFFNLLFSFCWFSKFFHFFAKCFNFICRLRFNFLLFKLHFNPTLDLLAFIPHITFLVLFFISVDNYFTPFIVIYFDLVIKLTKLIFILFLYLLVVFFATISYCYLIIFNFSPSTWQICYFIIYL